MNVKSFVIANIFGIIMEYSLIFLFLYYGLQLDILLSIIYSMLIFLTTSLIVIYSITREIFTPVEDDLDLFRDYLPMIQKASKIHGKQCFHDVINEPGYRSAAMYYRNHIYINIAYALKDDYLDGVISHELGHFMSGFTNHMYLASFRITTSLASIIYFIRNTIMQNPKLKFIHFSQYILYVVYVLLNYLNYFIFFPFLRKEEMVANELSMNVSNGQSLRTYYFSQYINSNQQLDLFDFAHPSIIEMINQMNLLMNYTLDYEKNVYGTHNKIFFVSNAGTTEEKQRLKFLWYLNIADTNETLVQSILAHYYLEGIGTTKDIDEAYQWYQKAADQGDIDAINRIKYTNQLYVLYSVKHMGEDISFEERTIMIQKDNRLDYTSKDKVTRFEANFSKGKLRIKYQKTEFLQLIDDEIIQSNVALMVEDKRVLCTLYFRKNQEV